MSVPAQPLKLNYAKGRQKSKSKNQLQSQQKIQFDIESSTDIFAHLNQDNLNYIKKQLKQKKSGQSQEKVKTFQLINDEMRDFIKVKDQTKDLAINKKDKKITEVTSSNSKELQKQKHDQCSDSNMAESIGVNVVADKRNPYQGLEPPPLTYTTKQKQPEKISQKFQNKHKSNSCHQKDTRNNIFFTHKNNFLQYELKSETSNNPIAQSNVTEEKQVSQDLSSHQKGSQFIDYLQSYIEELNGTGVKMFVRGNESVSQRRESYKQVQGNMQNFRKNKQKDHGYKQAESVMSQQCVENRQNSQQKMEASRNGYHSTKSNGKTFSLFQSAQNHSFKNNQQTYNHSTLRQNDSNMEELKRQLQKQKYCSTKLALELQKYKENETRSIKEIKLLQKTIDVLKIQVENVKQLYQHEAQQTQKILTFFSMQKQKDEETKRRQKQHYNRIDGQFQISQQKSISQPKVNYRQPSKSFNEPYTRRGSVNAENEFQNLMKFKDTQAKYIELKPKFLSRLMDEFHKGQQSYHNEKKTARVKHSQNNNQFYRSSNYFEPHLDSDSSEKKIHKKQKSSERQTKYLQNIFKRNNQSQESQRKKSLKQPLSSQSSQEIQREQSSLQKLKKQYEFFKAQSQIYRFDDKAFNKKRSSLKNPISTKQFSQVFVK